MTEIPPHQPMSRGRMVLAVSIGTALTAVIIAPIALSSQDLVKWGHDPAGLGLTLPWAWVVFIALDLAAAVCVGMVTYSAWRGESGGVFHLLTWMFAATSAWANYQHGLRTPHSDARLFFPAMSLMGPLLLEVTLHRVKRWARIADRQVMTARPSFGSRWLPGVAFRETLAAWATAKRENIGRPEDAIAHVRERRALQGMDDVDAIRYAWSALSTHDEYTARVWLQARGRTVTQAAMDMATSTPVRPGRELPVVTLPEIDPGHRDPAPVPALTPAAVVADRPDPEDDPDDPGPEDDPGSRSEGRSLVLAGVTPGGDLAALGSDAARVRAALAALGTDATPAEAREWLTGRGVTVKPEAIKSTIRRERAKTRTDDRAPARVLRIAQNRP